MDQNNSDWEKLINITNDYDEINKDISKNATQIINVKFDAVKQKRSVHPIIIGCICLVFLIVASMLIYLLVPKQTEFKYYSYNDLEKVKIENINEFITNNDLNVCVFDEVTIKSEAIIIKENNKTAYLNQTGFLFAESNMDTVNLYIKVVDGSKFEFEDNFVKFDNTKVISTTRVNYSLIKIESGYELLSKFEYNQVDYYLSIKTSESDVDVIMQHIEILIKD